MTDGPRASLPDLILIGLRASGKTSLGRALAELSGAPFIDLDDRVAERAGASCAGDVLRMQGEPRFRALELETLGELLGAAAAEAPHPTVIALGGGTPMAPAAAELLRLAASAGQVRIILLEASLDALADRLARDHSNRPPLTALSPRDELALLATQRLANYRAIAHATLDTTTLDPPSALRALEALWLRAAERERS